MKWTCNLPLPTPKPHNTQPISNTPCLLVFAYKPDLDTKRNKIPWSLELNLNCEETEHVSNFNTGLRSANHRAVYIVYKFRHSVLHDDWQGFEPADYHSPEAELWLKGVGGVGQLLYYPLSLSGKQSQNHALLQIWPRGFLPSPPSNGLTSSYSFSQILIIFFTAFNLRCRVAHRSTYVNVEYITQFIHTQYRLWW